MNQGKHVHGSQGSLMTTLDLYTRKPTHMYKYELIVIELMNNGSNKYNKFWKKVWMKE